MRSITEIILHCSATKEGVFFDARDIDRWHRQRGFRCIGYHYVIKLDGTIQEGRRLEEVGAHVTGHNAHSIGICYIGGLDSSGRPKDTRTAEQKRSMLRLLKYLHNRFPQAKLYGHNEFANKECPCFKIKDDTELLHIFS